jgi:hypothetical protein
MEDLFFAWVIFSHGWILMVNFNSKFALHVWFLLHLTCYFQLIASSQVMFCCSKTHWFTILSFAMCDNWQSMALQSCVPSPRT